MAKKAEKKKPKTTKVRDLGPKKQVKGGNISNIFKTKHETVKNW